MENLSVLKHKIEELKVKLSDYEKKVAIEQKRNIPIFENNKLAVLENEMYEINNYIHELEQNEKLYNMNPTVLDDFVDLYQVNPYPKEEYKVCIHNTKNIVGEIGISYDMDNNIYYEIKKENRNNGYGFHALYLLINYLVLRNIDSVKLVINEENKASIKMAKKLELFFPNVDLSSDGIFVTYRFKLDKNLENSFNNTK